MPPNPRSTLRHRLTSHADTGFFGCQSVVYSAMVAPFVAVLLAAIAAPLHLAPTPTGLAAGTLAAFILFLTFRLRRTVFAYVEVGADGIVVDRRFIAYREITSVSTRIVPPGGTHAVLRLRDGNEAIFRIDAIEARACEALLARLRREIAAYRAASRDEAALAVLDRGDRSVGAWRQALGSLMARSEGYREAAIALADVHETLENAAAPPDRRIGAAITLAGAGEADAPARIRVAASECADERLRIALESIAAGETDDEAVEEALRASRQTEARERLPAPEGE
jgi:hypothetical protein